jgi:two-component system, NarL family, nitrate/nitrite response regulator NarL
VSLSVAVIGTTRLCCEGVALLAGQRVAVALVDTAMPDAVQLMRAIAATHPAVKVVAFGVDEDGDSVIRFAESGAAGYVPRSASLDHLVAVLQSVEQGESPCSPRIAAALLRHVATLAASSSEFGCTSTLTQREREIVELIGIRMSNKQIARHLGIEAATVKNHVHHILAKLHARSRQDIMTRMRFAPR